MDASLVTVTTVSGKDQLFKFASLPMQVYAGYAAWWPPDIQHEVDLLSGCAPISSHLDLMPFAAWRGERMLARATAVVNHRYNQHWQERLGQLIHFEAMPDEENAVLRMVEAAAQWLRQRGMTAMRSGFAAFLDYPYAIDNYGSLSSFLLRNNPAYYHRYLKNAGFETERGLVDYTATLNSPTLTLYQRRLEAVATAGIEIVSWRDFGFLRAIDRWTEITNVAFEHHWGWNPVTCEEVRPMLSSLADTPVADLSMIASIGGDPIGAVFSVPDFSPRLAHVRPGYRLEPGLGGGSRGALINISVVPRGRGKGVALGMAARSFLKMAELGLRFAGYTLVLDDNWPSRRTAERLGGRITANFVVYWRRL